MRPKLIESFNEIRQYGVATDKLIDLHEQIAPLVDQISGLLVQAGIEHVVDRINPGAALPPDTEVAELITMLVRFRTQAVSAVSATLAFSIESTIESAVGQILGDFIDKAVDADTRRRRPHFSLASRRKCPRHAEENGTFASARAEKGHSHSMVPGGLLVISSATRLTSGTSLVMRVEMRSSTS